MIRSWLGVAFVVLTACRTASPVAVIPEPVETKASSGSFRIGADTVISAPQEGEFAARYFADLATRTNGVALPVHTDGPGAIAFVLDRGISESEAYELRVTPKRITITASDPRGLLYGGITLWELMDGLRVPAVEIRDAPRFAWRGLMLDSARHYQTPRFIERFLDTMALHKLNVLHWHLTDDQAWRLEIKKYPRLAEIGGWRVPAGAGGQRTIGGIYTQDEVRHIVAYAAERGITIVPEIEMPGHATAAIVAYPQLASIADPPTKVPADWGVYPNLYNIDDATFAFLEDVLTEVMALFPSKYIHVGGDEAVKDQWKASARIQARMRELGVEDETKLQSWFIRRIEKFLDAHGRRLIGWDEILEGGIAPEATVMSWRGTEGAITAAKSGHDAVLAAWPTLYFDNRVYADQEDPPGRGRVVTTQEIYAFDPLPATLTASERKHILGLQGNLWTEHIRTEERVESMAWPRAAAVAEIGWTPQEKRDWASFARRLETQFARYRALGVRAARRTGSSPSPGGLKPALRKTSHQLKQCSDKLVLSLEDDAPVDGTRAIFLIDIMNPCWIDPAVDLTRGATLKVAVGQVPFNFQIGEDVHKIALLPPSTPEGELLVFGGGACEGTPLATLPLAPAAANPGVTVLPAVQLAPSATQDLCFRFTQRTVDPMWALHWIEIERNGEPDSRRAP